MMLELNKLYNCCCMEGMAHFPDKYFELAIVDPPYGVGSVTYMPRTRVQAFGGALDKYEITIATLDANQRKNMKVSVEHHQSTGIRKFGDENISPPPEYFKELFRVSKNQIIWGGNYFLLPPSRGFIVWRKTTVSESFSMAMCEYAWASFNTNSKWFEGAPQGNGQRFHPTQKPVALYEFCLRHFAKPGDKILDTHAGSASSMIAAYGMGHDYIGFEIDPDYYAAASKRVAEVMAQGRLFDAKAANDKPRAQDSPMPLFE